MRKLELFFFRYFSQETLDSKDGWVRRLVGLIMFVPFLIAFVLTIMWKSAKVPTYIFMGMLIPFAIVWIVIFFYHNWRIKHNGK